MTKTSNNALCMICDVKLIKNGKNKAGTQRWKCPKCGASSVRKRQDLSAFFLLQQFLEWLLGKQSQKEVATTQSDRSFRRKTAWCWFLKPTIPVTGEVYDEIQLDGFNLRAGWCLLVASAGKYPVAWQWAGSESSVAWNALLEKLPEPAVVVCDGGTGIHSALKHAWPNARVQRCLVHVQRNVRKHVTIKSKSEAGRALWGLARRLTRVRTVDESITWLQLLAAWETEFLYLTKERSYAKDNPDRPPWVKSGQVWWYTHQRLRSGHYVLSKLVRDKHLFTFLEPDVIRLNISSTTNMIEGGINSGLRAMLHLHRGLTEEHQKRACEWFLYMRSKHPDITKILRAYDPKKQVPPKRPKYTEPDPGPELYGTALTAEEGLWNRSGWAGRG